MTSSPLHIEIDTDALTLRVGDGPPIACSPAELCALWLLFDGFAAAEMPRYLGDDGARDAIAALVARGIDPARPFHLTAPGHILNADAPSPATRHISGKLRDRAEEAPNAEALLIEAADGSVDAVEVGELSELVQDVASRLRGDGLRPGAHIALASAPSFERVTLALAAWEIGVSVVILRPTLTAENIAIVAETIRPDIWFMERIDGIPPGATCIDPDPESGDGSFDDWLEGAARDPARPDHDPDREAMVLTSSGSTGRPKMLALSQRGLFNSARYSIISDEPRPGDRVSASIDMSAMSGLRTYCVLPALGRTSTFIPRNETRDSSLAFFAAIAAHDVAHIRVIPGNLRAALAIGEARIRDLGITALRTISSGGSALNGEMARSAATLFGTRVFDHYGMTETSGSFGRAENMPATEAGVIANDILTRIVPPDGSARSRDGIGPLQFFDASLYLGEYTETGFAARKPGWFTCNDMAHRGAQGEVVIAGRSDGMLKTVEGEFLSPTAVLRAVLSGGTVQDALVIPLGGAAEQVGYALIVETPEAAPDLETQLTHLVRASLGRYAVPTRILALPTIPRLNQGKPDLVALRAIVASETASEG